MPCHAKMKTVFLQGLVWLCLWKFGEVLSALKPGYLDFDNLPDTNFSCVGKVIGGYYADVETNCQMFHVCTIGQLEEPMDIRFLCLNGTVFDQETRVCERVDEVDCSKSEKFYSLNLELYGNTAPSVVEEVPESEPPQPVATTTSTTTPRATERPTASTTTHATPKVITSHHFPVTNPQSPDIRFNPEEINFKLTPGTPPIIKAPVSFQQQVLSGGETHITVTTHKTFKTDRPQISTYQQSTPKRKSVVNYGLQHSYGNTYGSAYQTERPGQTYELTETEIIYEPSEQKSYQSSTTAKAVDHTQKYQIHPYSLKPHVFNVHQTDKPSQQLPLPVLPTLSPIIFSSPSPFTLERHTETKRGTSNQLPRIIISASASVSDSSGRKLNYSLGTIGTTHLIGKAPESYDDYKEHDVGLDPFYLDVPKVKNMRQKRDTGQTTTVATSTTETPTASIPDYVDDNYEPETYREAPHSIKDYKLEHENGENETRTHSTPLPDYVDDARGPVFLQHNVKSKNETGISKTTRLLPVEAYNYTHQIDGLEMNQSKNSTRITGINGTEMTSFDTPSASVASSHEPNYYYYSENSRQHKNRNAAELVSTEHPRMEIDNSSQPNYESITEENRAELSTGELSYLNMTEQMETNVSKTAVAVNNIANVDTFDVGKLTKAVREYLGIKNGSDYEYYYDYEDVRDNGVGEYENDASGDAVEETTTGILGELTTSTEDEIETTTVAFSTVNVISSTPASPEAAWSSQTTIEQPFLSGQADQHHYGSVNAGRQHGHKLLQTNTKIYSDDEYSKHIITPVLDTTTYSRVENMNKETTTVAGVENASGENQNLKSTTFEMDFSSEFHTSEVVPAATSELPIVTITEATSMAFTTATPAVSTTAKSVHLRTRDPWLSRRGHTRATPPRHRFDSPNTHRSHQRHRLTSSTTEMSSTSESVPEYQTVREINMTEMVKEKLPITDAYLSKSANPTAAKDAVLVPTTPLTKVFNFSVPRFALSSYLRFNCIGKQLNRFYEDPRDCRLFHYCTAGFTKTQVVDMKFVCDFGTFYDPERLVCSEKMPARCT